MLPFVAEGFRFHWNMALRSSVPSWAELSSVDFHLAESVQKPLPLPTTRNSVAHTSAVSVDTTATTSTASTLPLTSPAEVKKVSLKNLRFVNSAF